MSPGSEIERAFRLLVEIGPRRAGSDAERRAANALAALLGAAARPRIEPTYVHPQSAAVHMVLCIAAIAGSLLATASPPAGFGLVLAAATLFYLDLTGRLYAVRRLFFRRGSQNVVAPPLPEADDEETPLVLLCAHYDSGLTGAAYNRGPRAAWERVRRLWPAPISPAAVVFWSAALLVPPLGLRLAGIDESWVSLLQLPQTLLLIVAAFALGEISLSPPSPGANDGAAGAAAAVGAFTSLRREPPAAVDVHLLLTGAGESTQQGLRELLRHHRKGLRGRRAWLIDIDSAGRGNPRWVRSEVPVLTQRLDPGLDGMLEALADGDERRASLEVGPAGGASIAMGRGIAAAALTAREDDGYLPPDHRTPADRADAVALESVAGVAELAVELVRLIDRDAVRRAAGD